MLDVLLAFPPTIALVRPQIIRQLIVVFYDKVALFR